MDMKSREYFFCLALAIATIFTVAATSAQDNSTPGGGKRIGVVAGGGSAASESSVNNALEWLATRQEADGRWNAETYGGVDSDPLVTGLATLAFLSAGHTERTGKYKGNIVRAIAWIVANQDADGCIGKAFPQGPAWQHAVCGTALSKAYGMAKVQSTGVAAQKAVDYSINAHQMPYSGWGSTAKGAPDVSVTMWFVYQLKLAKVAGLKVPAESFVGSANFLDSVTVLEGADQGRVSPQKGRNPARDVTAASMCARLFMGWKPQDPIIDGAAKYLMEELPSWSTDGKTVDWQYLYFGTAAMFQAGGDYWKKWNEAMKNTLITNQVKEGEQKGSWPAGGEMGRIGGTVATTALGALCLEVYYRYLPMYC
jgi:hypothetical protein